MTSTTRWTLFAVLIAINVASNVALSETWLHLVISGLTGLPALALLIDYFVKSRRQN